MNKKIKNISIKTIVILILSVVSIAHSAEQRNISHNINEQAQINRALNKVKADKRNQLTCKSFSHTNPTELSNFDCEIHTKNNFVESDGLLVRTSEDLDAIEKELRAEGKEITFISNDY